MAVLAAVAVAREEEGVGDLAAEAAGNMHELDEADDGGFGQGETFTSDRVPRFRLDYLRFAFYDKSQRPPDRHHGERLERSVQCKAAHVAAPKKREVWCLGKRQSVL